MKVYKNETLNYIYNLWHDCIINSTIALNLKNLFKVALFKNEHISSLIISVQTNEKKMQRNISYEQLYL